MRHCPARRAIVLLSFAALVLLHAIATPPEVRAAIVPPDFVDETMGIGLDWPVNFDFLPDGRVLVIEKNTGNIRIADPAVPDSMPLVGTVPGIAEGVFEGLLGIAVDPRWPQKPYLYTHSTAASGPNIRILRHQVVGDPALLGRGATIDPALTRVVLGDLPWDIGLHHGGTLEFGPDDFLYVALGDDYYACSAQDIEQLRGKILRLNVFGIPDGPGPAPGYASLAAPGNPFLYHPNLRTRLVYHFGLRNPWVFDFDPERRMVILDVGFEAYEEINVTGLAGRNFGWPLFEGPVVYQPGCDAPLLETLMFPAFPIPHDTTAFAVVYGLGGVCYKPLGVTGYPDEYIGQVFYYDLPVGDLMRLDCIEGNCTPAPAVPGQPVPHAWATGLQDVIRMRFGPDGALWYVRYTELRRIRYVGTVGVEPGDPRPARLELSARPTPAVSAVTLDFRVPAPGPARLTLFDAAGRRVRSWTANPSDDGRGRVVWDGRRDDGRPAGAGVFLARLEQAGRAETRRVIRLAD